MSYNKIKISLAVLFLVCFQLSTSAQLAGKIELTKDNRLLGLGTYYKVKSAILNEERPVIISLPEGYKENKADYPVLYLLDGLQNIKHIVGTVELLTESGIVPPMIIVGIESLDRMRDFTPSTAGKNVYGGTGDADIPKSGGAPVFLQFFEKELIPFVDFNFRTHPYRVLEGHSLGGLFCVYTLMKKPELFDAFIVQSPALWWNNEEMTKLAGAFFKSHRALNKSIYLGIGGGDGWGMRQELLHYTNVIKNNEPTNLHWIHEEVGDEGHDDARLLLNYYGLKFIFSDLKPDKEFSGNYSDESFLKGERKLMNKYGEMAKRPVGDYFNLALKLKENKNLMGAITVFKRASKAYPRYVSILTNLAELYEASGQINKAIETYCSGINISKKYKLGYENGFQKKIEMLEKE